MEENLYLIYILAKRDIQTTFRQTILGVLWFLIVPAVTTIVFTVLFRNVAGIPTNNIPGILFYFSGIMIWNFFSTTTNSISNVFRDYHDIMGKVYFPRIIPPLSVLLSNLVKFSIQFLLFVAITLYFVFKGQVQLSFWAVLTPVFVLLLCAVSLATGLIFCSLSFKYKDFHPILNLWLMIFMYATPIIYPISFLPNHIRQYAYLNPLAGIIEGYRTVWFKSILSINFLWTISTVGIIATLLLIGFWLYNKAEKDFVDTI